jgi:hypothetical protein
VKRLLLGRALPQLFQRGFEVVDEEWRTRITHCTASGKLSGRRYILQRKGLLTTCWRSLEDCNNHVKRYGNLESTPAFEFESIPCAPADEL